MNAPSRLHPALNGEVTLDGEFARLYYQRRLPHAPERVWAAITDPAQLKHWFMASSARIDGRQGGSFETVAGPAQIRAHGRIITWDPPRVYEHEWITEPRDEIPQGESSFVRWELTPVEGETLLTLEHRRLTKMTAVGFAPGWHAFLDRLAALLGKQPLPDWMQRFCVLQESYPGWEAPSSGSPGVLEHGASS
ncbi:MAG TPA: SRPBCC family protein [Opitutaceae bacterium]|jgi:uncharacterized protein YndB with AHSA1/START domain